MNYLKLSEIVEQFYKNRRSVLLGSNLLEVFKKIKGSEFENLDQTETRKKIIERHKEFLKNETNAKLPSYANSDTFDRNIRNWLTPEYNGKSIKAISRESILTLCFIFSLSDVDCNQLLLAAGQHPLHRGGDAEETIVAYCLKFHLGYASAVDIYKCYKKAESDVKRPLYSIPEEDRTNVISNKLALTKIDSFTQESNELNKENLLKELVDYSNNFSQISNKTHATIKCLKNKYSINGVNFMDFYSTSAVHDVDEERNNLDKNRYKKDTYYEDSDTTPLGDYRYCKDTFDHITKDLSKLTTQPTRFFIILISIFAWVKSSMQKSLPDFVDEVLFSCSFRLLDENYNEDAFVLELSKFEYGKVITYNKEPTNISCKNKNTKDVLSSIIATYLDRETLNSEKHILSGFELIHKNQFFSFPKKQLENIFDNSINLK